MLRARHAVSRLWAGFFWIATALLSTGILDAADVSEQDAEGTLARQILETTGVRGGLIVHLGCGDGRLTAALRAGERYIVQGLSADAGSVGTAREHIRRRGVYGEVTAIEFDGRRLPYADNLVNLVVAEDLGDVPMQEITRVLAPRGVAYFKREGQWVKQVKPWPADLGEWSHWRHGPVANPVTPDRVVGPPRQVQWVAGPEWQIHHDMVPSLSAMVSAGGRMFYIVNEAVAGILGLPGQWQLVARDAFNGVLLWKLPMAEWGWQQWGRGEMVARSEPPSHLARRLVAAGERVYATLGFNAPVTALNAATGETVRVYDRTEHASEIVYKEGVLFLAVNQGHLAHGPGEKLTPMTSRIMALRAETGEILWETGDCVAVSGTRDENGRITRVALTIGDEHAFFLDGGDVVALDLKTGQERWRAARPQHPELKLWTHYHQPLYRCELVYRDGVVLLAQPRMGKDHVPYTALQCELLALAASSGETLWERECYSWTYGFPPDLFVIDGLVWLHDAKPYAMVGVELASGKEQKRFSTTEAMESTHHHRCYREKATERFILAARRGTEFLDVGSGENILNHWVRGTCFLGIMPANGLLYAPPHPCVCYITAKLNGLHALAAERKTTTKDEGGRMKAECGRMKDQFRLARGPAFDDILHPSSLVPRPSSFIPHPSTDWPTYRHDDRRSGTTPCRVPAVLESKWVAEIGGKPSSPVASGGKVFVASINTHCVYALDAQSGDAVWDYTAGGKIDTPPTVYGELVLFGSADGWVYCLRASDGRLVWRLRAAPAERQVVDHGQLASAWPLHGSVLVHQGTAYVCAGRSSFLDGGVDLLALDPATGKVLQQERIYSPEPDTGEMAHCELPYDMPPDKPGALLDIMLTDGEAVYLRHLRFNPEDLSQYRLAAGAELLSKAQRYIQTRKDPRDRYYIGVHPGLGPQLISNSGLLDDTWYNQSFWTVDGRGHSQLLVFDADTIYGVRAYRGTGRHARDTFVPGQKGYQLFAMNRQTGKQRWTQQVPVRIRAMVLAGATLFAAGPPDVVPKDDPWAALEGRKGADLWAFSAGDGQKLAETKIPSPPVLDGLIAAEGRLYLTTLDGHLMCLGGE